MDWRGRLVDMLVRLVTVPGVLTRAPVAALHAVLTACGLDGPVYAARLINSSLLGLLSDMCGAGRDSGVSAHISNLTALLKWVARGATTVPLPRGPPLELFVGVLRGVFRVVLAGFLSVTALTNFMECCLMLCDASPAACTRLALDMRLEDLVHGTQGAFVAAVLCGRSHVAAKAAMDKPAVLESFVRSYVVVSSQNMSDFVRAAFTQAMVQVMTWKEGALSAHVVGTGMPAMLATLVSSKDVDGEIRGRMWDALRNLVASDATRDAATALIAEKRLCAVAVGLVERGTCMLLVRTHVLPFLAMAIQKDVAHGQLRQALEASSRACANLALLGRTQDIARAILQFVHKDA
jgi:hypothetical protein